MLDRIFHRWRRRRRQPARIDRRSISLHLDHPRQLVRTPILSSHRPLNLYAQLDLRDRRNSRSLPRSPQRLHLHRFVQRHNTPTRSSPTDNLPTRGRRFRFHAKRITRPNGNSLALPRYVLVNLRRRSKRLEIHSRLPRQKSTSIIDSSFPAFFVSVHYDWCSTSRRRRIG